MDGLRTNTQKKHFHIAVSLDGKLIATFGARTDTVLNALKSAYEQCCGYTQKPIEPLPEPLKPISEEDVEKICEMKKQVVEKRRLKRLKQGS